MSNYININDDQLPITDIDNRFKKNKFIGTVFVLLCFQITTTIGVCYLFVKNDFIRESMLNHTGLTLGLSIPITFITLIIAVCTREYKFWNLLSFIFFTLATSVLVSVSCAVAYEQGNTNAIISALAFTGLSFFPLVFVGYFFGHHFKHMGPFLGTALWILIIWGFSNIIFGWNLQFLYGLAGALVFSLYIVFDVYRIISDSRRTNDPIIASIELYLDVINLFLSLLECFSARD